MRSIFSLIICLMFLFTPALADQKIYDPKQPVIPKYIVRDRADGTKAVYNSCNTVLPKYIVKPDPTGNGYRVYEPDKPVLPLYRIDRKEGLK